MASVRGSAQCDTGAPASRVARCCATDTGVEKAKYATAAGNRREQRTQHAR